MSTTCNSSGLLTACGSSQEGFLLRKVQTQSALSAVTEDVSHQGGNQEPEELEKWKVRYA